MIMRDWITQALCRNHPSWLFFPEDSVKQFQPQQRFVYEKARMICGVCPVRADCLDIALQLEGTSNALMRHGMWGGLTPRERYNLPAPVLPEW